MRLIYFLPRDHQPQPDIDAKMDTLIKDAQRFYAKQMEAHGFGRKLSCLKLISVEMLRNSLTCQKISISLRWM